MSVGYPMNALNLPDPLRVFLHGFSHLIWPYRCLVCHTELGSEQGWFCAGCRSVLTDYRAETCPRCASTVGPHTDLSAGCLRCRNSRFHFESATRLGLYDGTLREVVLKMKHDHGELLAYRLGELWGQVHRERLLQNGPQVLVPVPLHWRRRWTRGYNQSEEIARGLAKSLGLPLWDRCLIRTRATPHQTAQTPTVRRTNVLGAFRVGWHHRVTDLRILLIDDVLTTGATADSATTALKQAGAAQVHVAVIAHR